MGHATAARTTFTAGEYGRHLRGKYLDGFVADGGSSVKVVAGEPEAVDKFSETVRADATVGGFVHAKVDAAFTRIHLPDEIFQAVSRQVDWHAAAASVIRSTYDELGMRVGERLDIRSVAAGQDVHVGELYRSMRRALERTVLGDWMLASDFRVAMLRLCQDVLGWGDVDERDVNIVLRWLRGQSVEPAELRSIGLNRRILRQNARSLLTSAVHWLRHAGFAGLVLELSLARLEVARRPSSEMRRGFYYTKASVLDAYEVLRQFIDGCDDVSGLMLVVLVPPGLVADEGRGIPAYRALHLRLVEEYVAGEQRANPFAPLVRLAPVGGTG